MKWRTVKKPIEDITKWNICFLWKPTQVGDYKYWLCFMWRRCIDTHGIQSDGTYTVKNPSNYYKWEYHEPVYY